MKITPNDNGDKDWHGNCPICTVKGSELAEVAEWLWIHDGAGYAFAIMFNMVPGTYPVPEQPKNFEVGVLYLDELFEMCVEYIGKDEAQERLDKMKGIKR